MKATPFEFRFRYAIHSVLFFLGFAFYWLPGQHESIWLVLTPALERTHLFTFTSATVSLLIIAMLCATLAALLRTWGAAYLGAGIVQSSSMHGDAVLADGPYRHSRNPLYLGTFLHAIALSLLMSPWGALFTILTIGIVQFRLIFAEEPYLAAKLGEPYLNYLKRVPRLLPSLPPRVPASGRAPHWLQAVLGESYMIGVAICFAIFGWRYNAFLITKCIIICLGVSLVLRAFVPQATKAD